MALDCLPPALHADRPLEIGLAAVGTRPCARAAASTSRRLSVHARLVLSCLLIAFAVPYPGRRSCPSGCRRVTIPASILIFSLFPFLEPEPVAVSYGIAGVEVARTRVTPSEDVTPDAWLATARSSRLHVPASG